MVTVICGAIPYDGLGQELDPQDGLDRTCWQRAPSPGCTLYVVTEAGGYVGLGDYAGSSASPTVDWGLMWNQSSRSSFGVTLTVWGDNLFVGPALRYRRWLDRGSFVFAVGVVVGADGAEKPGSLFGLIRYDLNDWFGIGLRPQHLRLDCEPPFCSQQPDRIYVGAELGSNWGRWTSIIGGALTGLIVAVGT